MFAEHDVDVSAGAAVFADDVDVYVDVVVVVASMSVVGIASDLLTSHTLYSWMVVQ